MANNLGEKIIKQIQYYFGDFNLPRDKFMQEKIKTGDGWIDIDVLLTFKRLANLTTDSEVIVNTIKESNSDLIEVSDDLKKIRRSPNKPLPELDDKRKKELSTRTAYAKGFPLEESLDSIISFLKPYGEIDSCIKRTYLDKATKQHIFKGSCFVIFKNKEDCDKFILADSIKYKEEELIRKPQEVYYVEKKKEIEDRKNRKKQEKLEQKKDKGVVKIELFGTIVHFSGIEEEQILTREEIKEKIRVVGKIEPSFIYFNKGETEGYIRFPEQNSAVDFYKNLTDGKLQIGEITMNIRVLEGEEEKQFLKKIQEDLSTRRNQWKGKKNRKWSNKKINRDEPKAKKIKLE